MPQFQLNAILQQRVEVAPGLAIFRVVPEGWDAPEFKPGQFAVLGLPGDAPCCEGAEVEEAPADPDKPIRRAYSIASSSVDREYLEFYIALVRSGALTPRLFALEPGNRLWLSPKISGMFTLDQVPDDRHLVFIATGTGLAPYMSMLRSKLSAAGTRHFAVLHGARHSWDLGYRSELLGLARICTSFHYLPIISRPGEEHAGWTGQVGYVQDLWDRGLLRDRWPVPPSPESTHIFLCGNPGMIDGMVERLAGEGFSEHRRREPGQVHVERYW